MLEKLNSKNDIEIGLGFFEQSMPVFSITNKQAEVTESHGQKIYLDKSEAIKDFDQDLKIEESDQGPGKNITEYLNNAQILIKHKDYSLALNLLREASNRNSHHPRTLKLLAKCLDETTKTQEAIIAYKALVKVDYGFESLFGYGNALYKVGQDQEALEKYFEALANLTQEHSDLFELYKNMGNIFVRKGDFEAAEEYYNKAYTINNNSDVLLINFGTLEVQRNDFEKALYCFRKAVEINPESDKAWVGLAMVHSQLSDTELAWANLDTALEINPKNRTAVHLAANWGHRDQRLEKAILALENLLGSVEVDEDMSLVLINLFCMSGKYELAELEIERVLAWNPDQQEVRELQRKLIKMRKRG
jgi:tetratricopeptide (TPR) repeat protein